MSPKGPCIEGLYTGVALLGGSETFKTWGLTEVFRLLGVCS
jgi:hypothetical protein